jgi:ABC-type Mn2+/Zn2+ transport system ATPase subunit
MSLVIRDATICYDAVPAVHHLSAEVPVGALCAVLGPNGAGKSTLMKGILGWLPLATGSILWHDRPPWQARDRLAWLPQRAAVDWDFPITVAGVVEQGLCLRRRWWQGFTAADHAAVVGALDEMGLAALADRGIARLSGGQQQRALIARALASGADLLLLDEPLAGLDPGAAEDLAHALAHAARRGRTILMVAHDLALVRAHIPHCILMATHLVAAGPTAVVLSDANLRAAYGERAMEGVRHALSAHG